MNSERQQINSNAGIHHTLSRQILGIDWYDTESSARRVIEWLAEGQEPVATVTGRSGNMLRVGWLNPDVCEVGGIDGCALELFGMVSGRDSRELLMAKMRERHERLCELEEVPSEQ